MRSIAYRYVFYINILADFYLFFAVVQQPQVMQNFVRLISIFIIIVRYRLDDLLLSTPVLKVFKPLIYLMPWHYFIANDKPRGERIRLGLEALGPIFIKFGQTLSTRGDLLPEDIHLELAKLQDKCPPFDSKEAISIVEKSLGAKIGELFKVFDIKPLAAASIAQVHSAITKSGNEVVLKIVRPNVAQQISKDISLMRLVAKILAKHPDGKRLNPKEVVLEFEKIITNELDMLNEAVNTDRLRKNFLNSNLLYVPKVYWDLSSRNILVSERIYGTAVNDIKTLQAKNINLKQLAENGVIIFFSQVFEHNFFHADMHPGNIFVADDGKYLGVDFGIMGSLSDLDKYYLAESFLGFFNKDYRRIALAYLKSGWVKDDIDIEAFTNAIAAVCTPLFQKPLDEISFGQVLLSLLQQAKRFDMYIQPQLILLDKTLLNIEGLGRQLYPKLDLWATAKPFLEKLSKQKYSPKQILKNLKQQAPEILAKLPELPVVASNILQTLEDGNKKHKLQIKQLQQINNKLEQQQNKQKNFIFATISVVMAIIVWQVPIIYSSMFFAIFSTLAVILYLRSLM